jgi:hypothetical protein
VVLKDKLQHCLEVLHQLEYLASQSSLESVTECGLFPQPVEEYSLTYVEFAELQILDADFPGRYDVEFRRAMCHFVGCAMMIVSAREEDVVENQVRSHFIHKKDTNQIQ